MVFTWGSIPLEKIVKTLDGTLKAFKRLENKAIDIFFYLYGPTNGLYARVEQEIRHLYSSTLSKEKANKLAIHYRKITDLVANAVLNGILSPEEIEMTLSLEYQKDFPEVMQLLATKAWKRMFPGREIPEYIKRIREH